MEKKTQIARKPIIQVSGVKKSFKVGQNKVKALKGVDLDVNKGDFVVVFGPSGCGKTTLLNIIAGLDTPSSGEMKIGIRDLAKMDEDARAVFRSKIIGMVHQMSYWVKSLTTLENVALPLIIEGKKTKRALEKAQEALDDLSVGELGGQLPTQLSGGQQQKVQLARALVTNPPIILADEPTGNLDSTSADEMMGLFDYLNKEHKRTIIMVTHNQSYWDSGTRRIEMHDGIIVREATHG